MLTYIHIQLKVKLTGGVLCLLMFLLLLLDWADSKGSCTLCKLGSLVPILRHYLTLMIQEAELQLCCYGKADVLDEEIICWFRQCSWICSGVMEALFLCLNVWVGHQHGSYYLTYFSQMSVERPPGFSTCLLIIKPLIP